MIFLRLLCEKHISLMNFTENLWIPDEYYERWATANSRERQKKTVPKQKRKSIRPVEKSKKKQLKFWPISNIIIEHRVDGFVFTNQKLSNIVIDSFFLLFCSIFFVSDIFRHRRCRRRQYWSEYINIDFKCRRI